MSHDRAPLEFTDIARLSSQADGAISPSGATPAVPAFARELAELVTRAASWAGEGDVFLWFIEELADICVRHPGFAQSLPAAQAISASLRRAVIACGGRALRDAQTAGLVRPDLEEEDLLTIASLLGAGLSGDAAERHATSLRTRMIVLDGLGANAAPASGRFRA